jgi:hypothetical protein
MLVANIYQEGHSMNGLCDACVRGDHVNCIPSEPDGSVCTCNFCQVAKSELLASREVIPPRRQGPSRPFWRWRRRKNKRMW